MAYDVNREYGWDEAIDLEPSTFTVLTDGEYEFTVTDVERQYHNGSAKLPPCPKAALTLKIETVNGSATIKHNLFLHGKTMGLVASFFISIGQGSIGDKSVKTDWSKVIGSKGRARIYVDHWTKRDGTEGESNKIKEFLPPLKQSWTAGEF